MKYILTLASAALLGSTVFAAAITVKPEASADIRLVQDKMTKDEKMSKDDKMKKDEKMSKDDKMKKDGMGMKDGMSK